MRLYRYDNPQRLEEVVNEELDLRATQGSGNVKGNGDGIGKSSDGVTYLSLLNDSKFTDRTASSISFLTSDWVKTEKAAARYGRIPIMTRGDHSKRIHVLLNLDDFKYIYTLAKEHLEHLEE